MCLCCTVYMTKSHRSAGAAIRAERERKKMTQREVADATGMTQGAISHVEHDTRHAGPAARFRVATVLGVNLTAQQVVGVDSKTVSHGA
jgi:transcriptional regulator with XRE-family HTH domain